MMNLVQRSKTTISKEVMVTNIDRDLCKLLVFTYIRNGYNQQIRKEAPQYFTARAKSHAKTFILTDIDRIDILKGIKEHNYFPYSALFLSLLPPESDLLEVFKQEAIDFVPKPVSIDVLLNLSKTLLRQQPS